jgi:CheY-like chemotaxis protein
LLCAQLEDGSPASRDLAQIRALADRAAALTRQLLSFSRRQPIEPVVLNMNSLVDNTSKLLRRIIGEDIELEFRAAPDLGNLRADPSQIEQVLMNLVLNARDAMPEGGKLIIETADLTFAEDYADSHAGVKAGRYVMLAVTDTGRGIDEETRAHIFEPFFTTKGGGQGTGLGLATVYGIVKQHGGNVWVYSEVGRGTTFKVYLPRVDAGADKSIGEAAEPGPPSGTETVLVVEDDDAVSSVARRVLEGCGYRVMTAASPAEARQTMAEGNEEAALLLADVVLPGQSGPGLYGDLSASHPSLKVLYISGYADTAVQRVGALGRDAAFLQKPFTPKALAGKVREVLDQSKRKEG